MNENYTDITVVLDRSGSMQSVKKDTEGGFNNFVAEQKKLPGECRLTLNQFDTEFENVYKGVDIREVPPLNLQPRGMTALLDAIGRSIQETGDRLRELPESQRPGKVIFVVITDGHENSSSIYSKVRIKEMLQHQEQKYNWLCLFIGANIDAVTTGSSFGYSGGKCLNAVGNARGTKAVYDTLSKHTSGARGMNMAEYSSAVKSSNLFDDEDKKAQEDAKDSKAWPANF